ncbi:MAG: hypothetical protein PHU14_05630 [Methylovulum sp.]|nr:hypothetical protein [Methylovulum sp.]
MKEIIIVMLYFYSALGFAKTMYKCTTDGVTSYQSSPCAGLAEQNVIDEKPVTEQSSVAAEDIVNGVEVGAFSFMQDYEDSIGNIWIVYKVGATNKTATAKHVQLKYKAVDINGFYITEVYLHGEVPAHSYRSLTDKTYLKAGELDRVSKWELDK